MAKRKSLAGAAYFVRSHLLNQGPEAVYTLEWQGNTYMSGNRWWGNPKETMENLLRIGRVRRFGNTLRFMRFLDDFGANRLSNLWDGIGGASDPIYVVQTNTKIIERCMLMTTDPATLYLIRPADLARPPMLPSNGGADGSRSIPLGWRARLHGNG